jgi:hypothetical protein
VEVEVEVEVKVVSFSGNLGRKGTAGFCCGGLGRKGTSGGFVVMDVNDGLFCDVKVTVGRSSSMCVG